MPRGRDNFTAAEADRIRDLLRHVRSAERPQQKGLRAQLRGMGFRIQDWDRSGSGFSDSDFDDLVTRGLISIEGPGESERTIDADWFVGLLRDVTEEDGVRVRSIDMVGAELLYDDWSCLQRVALGKIDKELALCAWPGEMKEQAADLYREDRVALLLRFLDEHREWTAIPRPHLAYNGATKNERLYLTASQDVSSYLTRWTEPDALAKIGGHPPDTVRSQLWPWLCEQGFTDSAPAGDGRLDAYMERLEQRRSHAHLRPGIELRRSWNWHEATETGREGLIGELRESMRELLEALQEPVLPRRDIPA